MSKFAILAAPRTGSNLLCTLLNSHPEILCHHEVFNPDGIFTALDRRHLSLALGSLAERDRDPLGFLERVWETGAGYRAVGFKWTRGQNETVLHSILNDPAVRKIVLQRRNRVKTFVSEKIAQRTQQWEVYSPPELVWPRPQVTIDRNELLHHIELNQQFYSTLHQTLSRTHQPFRDVYYETLFDPEEQRRLLEYLGVDDVDCPLSAASIKQNSEDLRESIANFEELAASLRGSELGTELCDRGM
jgi:LPS sulfotransferase NodH